MPKNGYWIECVPVDASAGSTQKSEERYTAVISAIPDICVEADSPDIAIERLRAKLRALSRYCRMSGKMMPERDNPVQPPRNRTSSRGWISVYIRVVESQNLSEATVLDRAH